MVSIEPADKGTAADGSVRLVYRDGSPGVRTGRLPDGGPQGPAAAGSGGEHPYPRRAGARGPQRRRFGRREGDGLQVPTLYPTLSAVGFVKSDKGMGIQIREFFNHPCSHP